MDTDEFEQRKKLLDYEHELRMKEIVAEHNYRMEEVRLKSANFKRLEEQKALRFQGYQNKSRGEE